MKSKLLFTLLIMLVSLNGILIYMLIKNPNKNKQQNKGGFFLIEQLHFSPEQEELFFDLDALHREKRHMLDREIRKQKDILFNSFGNESINIDSLINETSKIEAKKEKEVFTFFKSVRKICDAEQQKKFDEIINEALRAKGRLKDRDRKRPPYDRNIP